ncbi:histidine kinase [Rothia sp. SD9660Na]|uniref:sensor histidine kinase n=1 Tax=Rothia sp. SD9660Na TaxID=3047030 RepID=UPI0024BA4C05|nr:histidine kinase [Rothia sp. SD9660Na]WHS50575.1 histidine kinase [Rothia sp. SD9660Na]
MTQLLHTLRSLPTARPSRAVRLTTLILSLAIGATGFFQAVSHPDSYLSLHIVFFALITLWAALYYTAYRYSVYALCALMLLSSAYYDQESALLAFFILACTFLFVLTGPLPGIFLLAISHIAGEIITAYTLLRPFNLLTLSISLFLFIGTPLALRISWEQRRTLAQEYTDYKEQVAESNRALARELHDTVARHISVIGLTTGQGLDAITPSGKDAALHTIEEHTHKALTDMRLLIRTTRGDTDPTALPQTSAPTIDLSQTLAQARKDLTAHGFTLHENITITEADLPDGVRPTFHKLIQEICHNAKKYAQPGCTITVTAKPNLTGVTVTTSNPTAPSNPKKHTRGTGYGLVGIGERIRALGGTMHYGITDTTWNLTIHLPLATA